MPRTEKEAQASACEHLLPVSGFEIPVDPALACTPPSDAAYHDGFHNLERPAATVCISTYPLKSRWTEEWLSSTWKLHWQTIACIPWLAVLPRSAENGRNLMDIREVRSRPTKGYLLYSKFRPFPETCPGGCTLPDQRTSNIYAGRLGSSGMAFSLRNACVQREFDFAVSLLPERVDGREQSFNVTLL